MFVAVDGWAVAPGATGAQWPWLPGGCQQQGSQASPPLPPDHDKHARLRAWGCRSSRPGAPRWADRPPHRWVPPLRGQQGEVGTGAGERAAVEDTAQGRRQRSGPSQHSAAAAGLTRAPPASRRTGGGGDAAGRGDRALADVHVSKGGQPARAHAIVEQYLAERRLAHVCSMQHECMLGTCKRLAASAAVQAAAWAAPVPITSATATRDTAQHSAAAHSSAAAAAAASKQGAPVGPTTKVRGPSPPALSAAWRRASSTS